MTINLKYFSGLAIFFSATFFHYLTTALKAHTFGNIWWFALLFGVLLFAAGFLLGRRDLVRMSRSDLGFQYHLMTFIIVNLIGITWFFVSMGINKATLLNALCQCVPWGIGLLIHYYYSSKTIKGMNKEELFD